MAESPCVFVRIEKQSTGQAGPEVNRDLEVLFQWCNDAGRCLSRMVSYLNSSSSGGFGSGLGTGTEGPGAGGGTQTQQGTGGQAPSRPFMVISTGTNFTVAEGFEGTVYIDATADLTATLSDPFANAHLRIVNAAAAGSGFDVTLQYSASTIAVVYPQCYVDVFAFASSTFAWSWPTAVPVFKSDGKIYTSENVIFTDPNEGIFWATSGNYFEMTVNNLGAVVTTDSGGPTVP